MTQETIKEFYVDTASVITKNNGMTIYGHWRDERQIVPSTIAIEKDNTLSVHTIVHLENKDTECNVPFDDIIELELSNGKTKAYIKKDEWDDDPIPKIYTILVCEKVEEHIITRLNNKGEIERIPSGYNNLGSRRVWGYYMDKNDAIEALHFNMTDLNETLYEYACLEAFEEGISHPVFDETQWFKFDHTANGYFEIETPARESNTCCRAMG